MMKIHKQPLNIKQEKLIVSSFLFGFSTNLLPIQALLNCPDAPRPDMVRGFFAVAHVFVDCAFDHHISTRRCHEDMVNSDAIVTVPCPCLIIPKTIMPGPACVARKASVKPRATTLRNASRLCGRKSASLVHCLGFAASSFCGIIL